MPRPLRTPWPLLMAPRGLWTGLLALSLVAGCAARSPAAEARQYERWVRDLSSSRASAQEMGRAGLTSAGDAALPWLESEIRRGGRSAAASIALLGELATPAAIQILQQARAEPELSVAAEAALERAELQMRRALKREPSVALCEDYLALFSEREAAPAVARLRQS